MSPPAFQTRPHPPAFPPPQFTAVAAITTVTAVTAVTADVTAITVSPSDSPSPPSPPGSPPAPPAPPVPPVPLNAALGSAASNDCLRIARRAVALELPRIGDRLFRSIQGDTRFDRRSDNCAISLSSLSSSLSTLSSTLLLLPPCACSEAPTALTEPAGLEGAGALCAVCTVCADCAEGTISNGGDGGAGAMMIPVSLDSPPRSLVTEANTRVCSLSSVRGTATVGSEDVGDT